MFDKVFFKFAFGFLTIVAISFSVIIAVNSLENENPPAESVLAN